MAFSVNAIEITGALFAQTGVFQGDHFEAGLNDLIQNFSIEFSPSGPSDQGSFFENYPRKGAPLFKLNSMLAQKE